MSLSTRKVGTLRSSTSMLQGLRLVPNLFLLGEDSSTWPKISEFSSWVFNLSLLELQGSLQLLYLSSTSSRYMVEHYCCVACRQGFDGRVLRCLHELLDQFSSMQAIPPYMVHFLSSKGLLQPFIFFDEALIFVPSKLNLLSLHLNKDLIFYTKIYFLLAYFFIRFEAFSK